MPKQPTVSKKPASDKSSTNKPSIQTLITEQVTQCQLVDQFELNKLKSIITKRQKSNQPVSKLISKAEQILQDSKKIVEQRKKLIPGDIEFDMALPVCQARDDVRKAIEENQVVVIAGETGSGKTTQLPKICLQLGLGVYGKIGHTQPRRVAATSVARRIAEELKSELGELVGYSIRFNDQSSAVTPVRVMTDGILLNEITHDPLLRQYDTIIIDEAHERSLNIDFLLGYIRNILPKRPDLKVIITSATIDVERFSKHFAIDGKPAPILEISGRTYPVDVWYRPDDEENPSPQVERIGHALDELMSFAPGDILIFLSGEAEIRETAKFLRKERFEGCEVLPLYARLSMREQEKIFHPSGGKRRIILSTNVAETSVTVPGIRFVIDPGFARISRYSVRNKIQRLPIEKISQASANQRKGRCGRVADGVCIRLYEEEDFLNRPEFTDAEILRTNLAAVILQMKQLGLGDIEAFPFIDEPAAKQISDGLNLLSELQAVDGKKQLTNIGRKMARLPIEPRLARILLAAEDESCIREALILAAFLSVKDPREWPFEKRELAQQKHAKYKHPQSDFIAIINLWDHLHKQQEDLSNNAFRRYCQEELVNFNAYREWRSTFRQLKSLVKSAHHQTQKQSEPINPDDKVYYAKLHSILLTGLLSFIGQKDIEKGYLGTRQTRFMIHPQSANFKKQPPWVMAFEIVETTQNYARLTAMIETPWIETIGKHLIKSHYFDAHWEKKRGAVVASLQQTLLGLKIVSNRTVDYSSIEPELCRELFILHGLVRRELEPRHSFQQDNEQLWLDVEQEIAKARQADMRTDERDLIAWFDKRLPESICNVKQLNQWLKKNAKQNNQLLTLNKDVLFKAEEQDASLYPETIQVKSIELPLSYHFEPGHPQDGVTVKIPQSLSQQFKDSDFERLVPGLLEEKIEFMLRSLPKRFRKNFVPIPQFSQACYEQVLEQQGSLIDIISKHLFKMTGVILPKEAWQELSLPEHYLMRFEIVGDKGKILTSGRTLEQSQELKQVKVKSKSSHKKKEETFTHWPASFIKEGMFEEAGTKIPVTYALEDGGDKVRILAVVNKRQAENVHVRGVCRLLALEKSQLLSYLKKKYHNKQKLTLSVSTLASVDEIIDDAAMASLKDLVQTNIPYDKTSFAELSKKMEKELVPATTELLDDLVQVLQLRSRILAQAKGLGKTLASTRKDIGNQCDYLFQPGFCFRFGADKIKDFKRYLSAIEKRIERAKLNPLKEAESLIVISDWVDVRESLAQDQAIPTFEVDEFNWMLEEFRISLFAQGQKTRFPISAKRLQKFVDDLEKQYY
ncbi:ATP-dependent RNA helicase HrpA [Kangiella koreensis]|uniref:ATP-dependent helicase HrpA n=1 Tax=Kangiella koreensis (strain DSM 16069 / JCM 12317 / KCTC 12182 / SW-125) TaxID=523791 RepID=C7RBD8_KANKD|nr:ATP-dependent RNA helicase HrpA [Kangiella koreensis]ACV26580.1 ATP-dependent helicase HrpA [Kangiella koreensis DSM 16069]